MGVPDHLWGLNLAQSVVVTTGKSALTIDMVFM